PFGPKQLLVKVYDSTYHTIAAVVCDLPAGALPEGPGTVLRACVVTHRLKSRSRRTACSIPGLATWRSTAWRAGARQSVCPRRGLRGALDPAVNLAACVTVNRFLSHLEVGRPPESLGGPSS